MLIAGVGASNGLGAAIARRFAAGGYPVAIAGRNAEKLLRQGKSAAAIGTRWQLRRGLSPFFYCHWGVGIGGGLVVDDEAFLGTTGNAMEIGHVCRRTVRKERQNVRFSLSQARLAQRIKIQANPVCGAMDGMNKTQWHQKKTVSDRVPPKKSERGR